MTVLKDLVREKLVEIIGLLEPGRPAALLLDLARAALVSGGMTLSDTIWRSELDLALVEAVEVAAERRAPDGAAYMQAVYLLSPAAASVELLLADYEDGAEPVYGGPAHVVFTRRLPEHLLARLKECAPLVRRARSLIEASTTLSRCRRVGAQFAGGAQFAARNSLGAQFSESPPSPPQRRVFSLDAPDALGAHGPRSRDDRDEAIGSLAEQLATLCSRRRRRPSAGAVKARAHPVARAFAESLHIELAKAAAGEDEHKRGGVASVLVLERGMDLTSARRGDPPTTAASGPVLSARPPRLSACQPWPQAARGRLLVRSAAAALGLLVGGRYAAHPRLHAPQRRGTREFGARGPRRGRCSATS